MKVTINALSQVGAGSRTYLANVLPRLARIEDGNIYNVVWPKDKKLPIGAKGPKVNIITINVGQKPPFARLIAEQTMLPAIARDSDVLLAPVDVGPLVSTCPVVLGIRNPNPFYAIARPPTMQLKLWMKRWLISMSAKRATEVFFVSEHSMQHIVEQIGISAEKASVIYHGIDRLKFKAGAERSSTYFSTEWPPYILTVSTVTRHKNFETLLEGYGQLPELLKKDYELRVAGRIVEPNYLAALMELAEDLGVGDKVQFLGEYPYEDIPKLYFGASAFVLPSFLETFGHTLIEAMASGIPVIAARSTCIPEIVQDAALLFNPHSSSHLAGELQRVLTEGSLRNSLVSAGYKRSMHFSWDKTVRQLTALLQRAHERAMRTKTR